MLATDGTPGLQVELDSTWLPVPPNSKGGLLIVNAGDQIEMLTNGEYRSARHRVVTVSSAPCAKEQGKLHGLFHVLQLQKQARAAAARFIRPGLSGPRARAPADGHARAVPSSTITSCASRCSRWASVGRVARHHTFTANAGPPPKRQRRVASSTSSCARQQTAQLAEQPRLYKHSTRTMNTVVTSQCHVSVDRSTTTVYTRILTSV